MKPLSPRLLIAVFFVIAFLFISFFVVITYKNLYQTKEINNKANKSLHFLLVTEKLLENTEELNTAQRGYVFVSKAEYFLQHENAVKKLLSHISSFDSLRQQNPARTTEITNIIRLVADKINDSKYCCLI